MRERKHHLRQCEQAVTYQRHLRRTRQSSVSCSALWLELQAFHHAWPLSVTQERCAEAFRKSGLVPFDPAVVVHKVLETKDMTREQALAAVQRACDKMKEFLAQCRAGNKALPYDLSPLRETIVTPVTDVETTAEAPTTPVPPPPPTGSAADTPDDAADAHEGAAPASPLQEMLQSDFDGLEGAASAIMAFVKNSSEAAAECNMTALTDAATTIRTACAKRKLQQDKGFVEYSALTKHRRSSKRTRNKGPCLLVGSQLDRRAARREKARANDILKKRRLDLVEGLNKYVPGERFTGTGSVRKTVSMTVVKSLLRQKPSRIILKDTLDPENIDGMQDMDLKLAALQVIDHRNGELQ